MKLMPCPLCSEIYWLWVIVDDKPSNTVNTSIISRDYLQRGVDESLTICRIISVLSVYDIQLGWLESDEANIDVIDLGDSSHRENQSNTGSISRWRAKLEFVGRALVGWERHSGNFEPVKEENMVDAWPRDEGSLEGHQYFDLLPTGAAC